MDEALKELEATLPANKFDYKLSLQINNIGMFALKMNVSLPNKIFHNLLFF